jgi:thioredoxin-like negative regulator of GroEL
VVRTLAEKLAGRAAVIQVNSDENLSLSQRFGVRGIPVLFLLQGGKVIDQLQGSKNIVEIMTWFDRKVRHGV